MIVNSVSELVGRTPIARLNRLNPHPSIELLAKLEMFNPTGSVKARPALAMIDAAEAAGLLSPGGTIVEPTSGNTGIALAAIAASRGYHMIVTMPESMSQERRDLVKAFGAELILTPKAEGMKGSIALAESLVHQHGYFMPSQFTNPANPQCHRDITAQEILRDLPGGPDVFVVGVGTGGTLMGAGSALKRENPEMELIAVEPAQSPVLSGGAAGPHGIQGIGAGFVPDILDPSIIDRVIQVSDEAARRQCHEIARREGLLVGISSGAAAVAALEVVEHLAAKGVRGQTVLTVFPDLGDRYLSILGTSG